MSVQALLDFIGKIESRNDPNAVWGGIQKIHRPPKPLTKMTVKQVLDWQDSIDQRYRSEAAGEWQFMEDTLRGLYRSAGVSLTDKFTRTTQIKLATQLLRRRGLNDYLSGRMSAKKFAQSLSKEWASLPATIVDKRGRPATGQSFYAGDGLNKAHTSISAFLRLVEDIIRVPEQTSNQGKAKMTMTTREIQTQLKRHGFDPGKIDGIMGPKTSSAIIAFKKSRGLKARDYVGPITAAALRKGIKPAPRRIVSGRKKIEMPPWLRLAYSYLGLREIPGPQHNREVVKWWQDLGLHFRTDETPWCAGFVNAMIQDAGLPITPKYRAAALGWRWTGYGTRLAGPVLGAVMSMTRPGSKGSGHQTIVAGRDNSGRIMGLGGNQGNAVSINPYHPTARDAQYHWPDGFPIPDKVGINTLPIITSAGAELTNEA